MTLERKSSAEILRKARRSAGCTQAELAERAGVAQSVISAYESGRREPAFSTLERLVNAAGLDLSIAIVPLGEVKVGLPRTPMGGVLRRKRRALLAAVDRYGVSDLKVFGSVARGEDGPDSDVDLVASLPPTMGLISLGQLERELSEILGRSVDLVPLDGLRPRVKTEVEADAVAL